MRLKSINKECQDWDEDLRRSEQDLAEFENELLCREMHTDNAIHMLNQIEPQLSRYEELIRKFEDEARDLPRNEVDKGKLIEVSKRIISDLDDQTRYIAEIAEDPRTLSDMLRVLAHVNGHLSDLTSNQ